MIRLLLIDTCGTEGSVALVEDSVLLAKEELPGRSASEQLISAVRKIMTRHGWQLGQLTAIAVICGPGSFTGIRVGISAAKGLSEASGIPLIAISRLALLANGDGSAALDAGRDEFYFGEYRNGVCSQEMLLKQAELVDLVGERRLIFCEEKVKSLLSEKLRLHQEAEPSAERAISIAMARVAEGRYDDPATLDANYLRRTDAQLFAWTKNIA